MVHLSFAGQRRAAPCIKKYIVKSLSVTSWEIERRMGRAREEKATIFTHDTDFLRIAAQWIDGGRTHFGVIYCHQNAYGIGDCIRNLKILVNVLTQEDMINHIEFLWGIRGRSQVLKFNGRKRT